MKKVLVLMLVLGMASLANAGLMLSWDNTSQTITLSSDIALVGGIDNAIGVNIAPAPAIAGTLIGPVTFRTIGAPLAAPIVARMTGTEAEANLLPYGGGFANFTWGDAVIAPAPAGDWLSFTMAGYSIGTLENHTAQVDLLGENVTGGSIYLVPEPATLAILGLGGLLLRRKKA